MSILKSILLEVVPGSAILQFNPQNSITEEDISQLRRFYSNLDNKIPQDTAIKKYRYNRLHEEVKNVYKNIYTTHVTKDNTWKEIADMYCLSQRNEKAAVLHTEVDISAFELSSDEFTTLMKVISDALLIYQREFELLDIQSGAKISIAADHPIDKIQDLTYELFLIREEAEQLRDMYYALHKQMENDFISVESVRIDQLENDIDFLMFRIEQFLVNNKVESAGIFSIFGKEKKNTGKEKKNILTDFSKISANWKELHKENPEDCLNELQIYKMLLKAEKQNLAIEASKKIRSANKFNSADPGNMIRLESNLKSLLKRINECGIFSQKTEINTLSFKKQTEFIGRLAFDLEIALLRIEKNISYYEWLAYLHNIDPKFRNLFHILKRFNPEEWLSVTQQWYHSELLRKNADVEKTINDQKLEDLCSLESELKKADLIHCIAECNNNRLTALKTLNTSDKLLFECLTKNKKMSSPMAWKHIFCKNAHFFSQMHVVTLLSNDDITDINENTYDELIYLNPVGINVEILQKFSRITTFYDEEAINHSSDMSLHKYTVNLTHTFSAMSMTERLPAARKLSEGILQFGNLPVVYQLRHSFIITFCPEKINQLIEDELYQFGLKQLLHDNDVHQTIIGALLDTDRSIYIITENLLINPIDTNSISFQKYILDQAAQGGCIVINLDTISWINNGDTYFNQLLDVVRNENLRAHPTKKQLKLEFK
jgi:hypothetical protein